MRSFSFTLSLLLLCIGVQAQSKMQIWSGEHLTEYAVEAIDSITFARMAPTDYQLKSTHRIDDGRVLAVLAYSSRDAQGQAVTLTGAVVYCDTTTAPKKFIEIGCHITELEAMPSFPETTLFLSKSGVLLMPHYLGYVGTYDRIHPYLNADLQAQNQIDFVKPAIAFLQEQGVTFSDSCITFAMGYSQGGFVALATQRAIERNPALCDTLRFKGSVCGAGPYSPTLTFESYLAADSLTYPCAIPLTVLGMTDSYPDLFRGISPEDYLSEEFLFTKPFVHARMKDLSSSDFNQLILTKTHNRADPATLFSPQALDTTTAAMRALRTAFDRNDLTKGWTPAHPIAYFHSPEDDVVPYENTTALLNAFGETGLLHQLDPAVYPAMGEHVAAGGLFLFIANFYLDNLIQTYLYPDYQP